MLDLFSEFNRIIQEFQLRDIEYTVVGGLAVAIHGGTRATEDMDFLAKPQELLQVQETLLKLGYQPTAQQKFEKADLSLVRFIRSISTDSEEYYLVDILIANSENFNNMIDNSLSEPWGSGQIRVARKEDLIWMKSLRDSHSDRQDIETLKNEKN